MACRPYRPPVLVVERRDAGSEGRTLYNTHKHDRLMVTFSALPLNVTASMLVPLWELGFQSQVPAPSPLLCLSPQLSMRPATRRVRRRPIVINQDNSHHLSPVFMLMQHIWARKATHTLLGRPPLYCSASLSPFLVPNSSFLITNCLALLCILPVARVLPIARIVCNAYRLCRTWCTHRHRHRHPPHHLC